MSTPIPIDDHIIDHQTKLIQISLSGLSEKLLIPDMLAFLPYIAMTRDPMFYVRW